jgi:hypothetical protein
MCTGSRDARSWHTKWLTDPPRSPGGSPRIGSSKSDQVWHRPSAVSTTGYGEPLLENLYRCRCLDTQVMTGDVVTFMSSINHELISLRPNPWVYLATFRAGLPHTQVLGLSATSAALWLEFEPRCSNPIRWVSVEPSHRISESTVL